MTQELLDITFKQGCVLAGHMGVIIHLADKLGISEEELYAIYNAGVEAITQSTIENAQKETEEMDRGKELLYELLGFDVKEHINKIRTLGNQAKIKPPTNDE